MKNIVVWGTFQHFLPSLKEVVEQELAEILG
jgi:hypothetical protein